LAAQNSLDVTTKQTGGDLGWFSRGELLQKSVEDSAFSLKVNEISAPVKSDLGYHIIQTLERVKDRPIDPETRFRLSKEAFERWVASLYRTAHVEKFPNGRS
jgi:parvulin-like peptidyl-prolyl isomerase